jgi:hypothetical protein
MKAMSRNMSSDLNDNEMKIFTRLESQSKAIKLIQYGLIGIFTLIVIVGVFIFLSSH